RVVSLSVADGVRPRVRALEEGLPLLPRQERAGETVDGDLRELVEVEAERLCRPEVFVRQRRAAHQPVVRVEHDVHPAIEIAAQRVRLVRLYGVRLDVACETDLERDTAGARVLRQRLALAHTR